MKTTFAVLLGFCLFSSAAPLRAEDPNVPKTDQEARAQFDAADTELNQIYLRCSDPSGNVVQSVAHLKKAQRLWIEYRDENAAAYQTSQSSRHALKDRYYFYAATLITWSRIQELKALFPEYDEKGNPVPAGR